jgi:hypothetical protein
VEGVRHYRVRPYSEVQVLRAFGLSRELQALEARERKRKAQKWLGLFALLLAFASFIGWGVANSGTVISANQVSIASVGDDGVRFRPVQLGPEGRVHRLTINGAMTETSAWVAGVLERADGGQTIDAQGELWDESGYDEGYWHESNLRAHRDFVVRQPGTYYVRLYAEGEPNRGTLYSVGYELRRGAMFGPYFVVYGFVALTLGCVLSLFGWQTELAKASQSD